MFPVSEKYRAAMHRPLQRYRLRGTIGGESFTEDNILAGSFTINNQCSGGDELQIGQVYIGELSATFIGLDLSRYSTFNIPISAESGLEVEPGVFEWVPLGTFYISEANHSRSGLEVTAYDVLSKLDGKCAIKGSTSTIYELMQYITRMTGVEFEQDIEEVEELPNGSQNLGLHEDNDIETYRDLLSWIAQTTATNATASRSGKIILRQYKSEPDDTIQTNERFEGSSYSDFETRITGVSIVDIAKGTTRYFGAETDDALTYNLGSNPLLQFGTSNAIEQRCRNILEALQAVDYVPFESSMLGSPAFELMDVLRLPGGLGDSGKLFCVTKYEYKYNAYMKVSGVGKNPALASARSKTDKNIAGLLASSSSNEEKFYNFRNFNKIHISDKARELVINQKLGSVKGGNTLFFGELLLDVETSDTTITVDYVIGENEIHTWHPTETYHAGSHVLNLFYPFELEPNEISRFRVYITASGGAVDIDIDQIRATIYGQGIVGDGAWDNTLEFADTVHLVPITGNVEVIPFGDATNIESIVPRIEGIAETVGVVRIDNSLIIANIDDAVAIDKLITRTQIWEVIKTKTWQVMRDDYTW